MHAALVSVDASMPPFTYRSRQYAATLKIAYATMRRCRTVEALQALAKRQYRALARTHHPDTSSAGGHRTWSQEFNRIHNAYQWFQQLQTLPLKPARETMPAYPSPGSMERRPLSFGYGWHETRL